MSEIPLGKDSPYPQEYAPDVLYGVARGDSRRDLRVAGEMPFHGEDIWNAWDLSWLDTSGRPVVATAELRVPANSSRLIESKSLKLYLGSLAMTRYRSGAALARVVARDLGAVAGAPVRVSIAPADDTRQHALGKLPGQCIDDFDGEFSYAKVDASLLKLQSGTIGSEELHSHLLRSNCPVTGQPDLGSILIRYRGRPVDHASLLQYLVSYRLHNDFHEACVERIFVDIRKQCATEQLTVYARYNRRGGLDINPFRSDFEAPAENRRLWRQ